MHNAVADWRNHSVTGHARVVMEKGGSVEEAYFDAPLISHVEGNLWQGGCMNGVSLDDDFVKVVSLYPWEKYRLPKGAQRIEVKMYDSREGVDLDDLHRASNEVLMGLEKGKTLVHCQAGLNRSGLVAAYTLMRKGRTADEAIQLLRDSRSPLVLCNDVFVNQLHTIEKYGVIAEMVERDNLLHNWH